MITAWDGLLKEWESATGRVVISSKLLSESNDLQKNNRVLGLICAYHLLTYGDVYGIELACYHGVHILDMGQESQLKVKSQILQQTTNINVRKLKKEAKKEFEEDKTEHTFYDLILSARDSLEGMDISNEINCLEWIAITKLIEKKQKAIKQHGRGSKGR